MIRNEIYASGGFELHLRESVEMADYTQEKIMLSTEDQTAPAPDCGQLFMGFFILGLTGFGGVLPMARHMLVDKRRWLTAAQFTELLGLC